MIKHCIRISKILVIPFIFLSQHSFADAAFDQCVTTVGEANDWTELDQYARLDCDNAGISSVGDLSQFPNLGVLILEGNNVSSLNVSANPALFHININGNSLSSLDISNNSNLSVLLAAANQLTGLNTSDNEKLVVLSLGRNNIGSLDFSSNPNLARVFVHNNNLSTLDISNSQGIYELTAGNNGLTSINLGPSGSLETLGLANNNLTTLDITGHGALSYLNVEGNSLDFEASELLKAIAMDVQEDGGEFTLLIDGGTESETIDFSDANFEQCLNDYGDANGWGGPADYTSLECPDAGITDVGELFHFVNLGLLDLSGNNLSAIDVSSNTALFHLNVNGNALTSLDISTNTNLSVLQAAGNQLSSLDTGSNTALVVINAGVNEIDSLDLSNNTNLGRVYVQDNSLSTLDVSMSNGITELVAGNNSLASINLGTGSLEILGLLNNQLTTLDITGHGNLNYLNIQGNPLDSETVSLLTGIAEEQGEDFTLLIDAITESVPPPEEPVPEAVRINTVGGSRTADIRLGAYSANGTPAYGNDFTAGDFITLYGTVTPDPVDVGVDGELYAALLSVVGGQASFSYVNDDGNFAAWDLTIPGLGAYKTVTPLEESHQLRIFEGSLQAGTYKVTFAYKAENGPLVFMKPITIKVSN